MLLENMRRAIERGEPVSQEQLLKAQKLVDEAIDQFRSFSREFSPVHLEGTGWIVALNEFAEQLSRQVRCEFICDKRVVINESAVALGLCRASQEFCRLRGMM